MYKVRETPILDDIIYPNYPDYHSHSTDYRNPQSYRHNHRNIHTYPYRDSYLTGSSNMTTVTQDSTDQLSVTPLVTGSGQQPNYGVIAKGRLSRPNSIMVSRPNSMHEIQSMCSERKSDFGDQQANSRALLFLVFSSLYAKLLIVGCFAFLISEILSLPVTPYYYEVFFVYLYSGSVLFLLYVYLYILRDKKIEVLQEESHDIGDTESYSKAAEYQMSPVTSDPPLPTIGPKPKKKRSTQSEKSVGSFYLRVGVVAFGVGGMIFNGLEFGKFFETKSNSPCFNIMLGITPLAQTIFTFFQLYFLFMNSRMCIHKYKTVARFGLMHMFATNVCVWLRTLIRETMHDMSEFSKKNNGSFSIEDKLIKVPNHGNQTMPSSQLCETRIIMGTFMEDASPFLYPLIVEYSAIAAGILFVMWKNIGHTSKEDEVGNDAESVRSRGAQFYKLDCKSTNKGLFLGLLSMVTCIICLILFFVLVHNEEYNFVAIVVGYACDSTLMFLCIFAMLIGFSRVKKLRYDSNKEIQLDDILIFLGLLGVYMYSWFGLIASYHVLNKKTVLVMVVGVLMIVEATFQAVFMKNAGRRYTVTTKQLNERPGRDIVTFLLICNLALWGIRSFETQRMNANPIQKEFFGNFAWGILSRISLPFCILFHFHSAAFLADTWRNAYRMRGDL